MTIFMWALAFLFVFNGLMNVHQLASGKLPTPRTHATIAAWSTHVPTVSIAYSVKAIGLNTDLFGDLRYVLETPRLSRVTLWDSLEKLRTDEQSIKILLGQRIPEWQWRARLAADGIVGAIPPRN